MENSLLYESQTECIGFDTGAILTTFFFIHVLNPTLQLRLLLINWDSAQQHCKPALWILNFIIIEYCIMIDIACTMLNFAGHYMYSIMRPQPFFFPGRCNLHYEYILTHSVKI